MQTHDFDRITETSFASKEAILIFSQLTIALPAPPSGEYLTVSRHVAPDDVSLAANLKRKQNYYHNVITNFNSSHLRDFTSAKLVTPAANWNSL